MKRIYFILALLLTFVGYSVTRALIVDASEYEILTSDKITDGTTVLIGCPISSYNANPVVFGNNDKFFDNGVANEKTGKIMLKQGGKPIDDCTPTYAWIIEASDEDGWYYIKNAETGRYWSYTLTQDCDPSDPSSLKEEGESEDQWYQEGENFANCEIYIELVENKEDAQTFSFPSIAEGVKMIRPDIEDFSKIQHEIDATTERGCVMVMAKLVMSGKVFYAAMNDAVPGGLSRYHDWACYMDVTKIDLIDNPFDEFVATLNELPIEEYPIGDNPGCVEQEDAARLYNETIQAYRTSIDEEHPLEYWKNALEELKAFLASMPQFTFKPVTEGYYRIPSAKNNNLLFFNNNGNGGCRQMGEEPSLNDLWKVYVKGGQTYLQNLGTMRYIEPIEANSQNVKGGYVESPVEITCRNTLVVGDYKLPTAPFNIKAGNYLHTQGTNLLTWWDAASIGDMWLFQSVSVDELKEVFGENILEELDLKDEFYKLLNEAQAAVTRAKSAGDEPLITNASQISSPKTQAGEGTIAALIDGDYGTYWHSEWSSGDVSQNDELLPLHYLQFNLGQAVSEVTMKYARRSGVANDHPTVFKIWACDTADGEYKEITDFPVARNEAGDTIPGADNVLYRYDINFGAAYQYVRVRAIMTDYWRGYWHASELYFTLQGVDLWTPVQAEGEALEEAIAAAKAAETITRELIDELRAAYEAFINAFPDPTNLKKLINEAKDELAAIKAGNDPGCKPEEIWNTLNNAVKAAEEWVATSLSSANKAQIAEQESLIKNALEAWYKTPVNYINTNTWYYIQMPNSRSGHTATNWYEAGVSFKNARLAARYADESELEDFGGESTSSIGIITEPMYNGEVEGYKYTDDMALWRFIDAKDGRYMIQNKATGCFMPVVTSSSQNPLKNNPVPGKWNVKSLDNGKFQFETIYGFDKEGNTQKTFINAYGQGYIGAYGYADAGCEWQLVTKEAVAADHEQSIIISTDAAAIRGLVLPYAITLGEGDAHYYTDVVNINTEEGSVELEETFGEIPAGKPFFVFNSATLTDVNVSTVTMSNEFSWSVDHSGHIEGTLTLRGVKMGAGVLEPTVSNDALEIIGEESWGAFATVKAEKEAVPGQAWIDFKGDESLLNNGEEGDELFVLDLANGAIQDAIAVVKGENGKMNVIYNLNGQRVSAPVKGVMIIGGKKVVVK